MTDNLLDFAAILDRDELLAGKLKSKLSCQVKIASNATVPNDSGLSTTANICLVFDCSASMRGRKFDAAVEAAKMIVDMLHERHSLSLVAFQSKSYVVFENAVPTEGEKDAIKTEIDKLDAHLGGGTNMAAGIESGMSVLAEGDADTEIIVLLSDGEPLFADRAQAAANSASQAGIQLFAVGIGESYNANQLLRLVTPSNGAVFGASEVDKLNAIFFDLIDRIDRIFATDVKLNFNFDERVHLKQVYKTSPERALYDSSTFNHKNSLELRVGNVEYRKVYEFLLQIEVDVLDVGAAELVKARLQYDISHLGINGQVQEITLTVNFKESDALTGTSEQTLEAMSSATMLQLCDDLMQACADADSDRALHTADILQQRCDEENNTLLREHLDSIKDKLVQGERVSDQDRNDFLLASTKAPPKAQVFDLILVDPGSETIRLLREIRNVTHLGLREVADIVKCRNSRVAIFKNKSAAEKLQQRLVNIGAKAMVHAREEHDDVLPGHGYEQ
jgi:Mg-chelatase subunit ChlD/ribosomal protein L7/L12